MRKIAFRNNYLNSPSKYPSARKLGIKKPLPIEDKDFKSSLQQLRFQIDDLDIELLDTLKRRMELVQKIGSHKKENKVTILQNDRWSEMLKTRSKYGKENGLSEQFVQQLLKAIHQESIDKQNNVMNNNDEI